LLLSTGGIHRITVEGGSSSVGELSWGRGEDRGSRALTACLTNRGWNQGKVKNIMSALFSNAVAVASRCKLPVFQSESYAAESGSFIWRLIDWAGATVALESNKSQRLLNASSTPSQLERIRARLVLMIVVNALHKQGSRLARNRIIALQRIDRPSSIFRL
jgi:hypothetical protein